MGTTKNEIENLKKQLSEANKTIEEQNKMIKDLKKKLNQVNVFSNNTISNYKNNINELQNIINQKNLKIQELQMQMNNQISRVGTNFVSVNDIMTVNFVSGDKNLSFAVPCVKNNTFAEVEEKLYKKFPEYRETNNSFIAEGKQVLRFKTIEENNIGSGLPVILIIPS